MLPLILGFFNLAHAADWDVTTQDFPIKSLLGPDNPTGTFFKEQIGSCQVGWDPNCLASDGGLTWTSSWPYATCSTTYDSTSNLINVFLSFDPGVDARGFTTWPTSWPSTIACTKTITSGTEAGKVHTLRVNVTTGDERIRYKYSDFSTTQITLAGGKALTVDSAFNVKAFLINIPDGNFTGNVSPSASPLYTAATGGSPISYAYCQVWDGPDDYLWVGISDSVTVDLNGASPGRGTFYCRVTKDGTTYAIPFSVTIN